MQHCRHATIMLRFHDRNDSFALELVGPAAPHPHPVGDTYVTASVASAGFSGSCNLWVLGSELEQFRAELRRLDQERHGEARLAGVDSRELTLVVRAIDAFGHLRVEGRIGGTVACDHGDVHHGVQFGFEFDPSQLRSAGQNPAAGRGEELCR